MSELILLLGISFVVLFIGLLGLIVSKNLIKMLLSVEIMFLGSMMAIAFLSLISPSSVLAQFIVLITAAIAAMEEAVGVGLIVITKKATGRIDTEVLTELKG